jgi:hypothetical protein
VTEPRTAEQPVWREWLQSWWVLLALLGWLNWSAFLYAGLRTHRRRWIAYAIVYLIVSAASLALILTEPGGETGPQGQIGAWLGLLSWGVSFVHALALRRQFLDRVEALEDPTLDAAEDALLRREVARRMVEEDPDRAREIGVGRPDRRGAFHAGLIDMNHAPPEVIARLPAIDKQLARRIVRLREEINGFSSLEDFGHVLDLPAPTVERLRERAVFLPR